MKNNSTELRRIASLWTLLARNTQLSLFVTDADEALFKTRLEAEGLNFVTVVLPELGKALDRSFRNGTFEVPQSWAVGRSSCLPVFLSKAWEVLFHPEGHARWLVASGELDAHPINNAKGNMGIAVRCIRQLTMAFYKYEQPWTKDQEAATSDAFRNAEDELWETTSGILSTGTQNLFVDGISLRTILGRAARLIRRVLSGVDPIKGVEPQYGTGATANKASLWGRWQEPRFIAKLDRVYPVNEWFFSGINGLENKLTGSRLLIPEVVEPGARVVFVPKDSRGPRLISAEPSEFMYIQLGLFKLMRDALERYPNVRAQVSITDQSRNQLLAEIGSRTGLLATLDLKEASDRVSWWLVTRLFPGNWVEAFDACRSEYTVMPNGDEIPLTKFAPMGSACCFPVEAMVFWALANAVREDWSERRFQALFDRSVDTQGLDPGMVFLGGAARLQDVCVFGDDIIVPTDHVDRTIKVLELVGLKVNVNKSFSCGPFRESCGMDYFAGYCTSPVRVKSRLLGDGIECLFRCKDVFNRMSLCFGSTSAPHFVYSLRDLYQEFFEVKIPITPAIAADGVNGLVLYDYHGMTNEAGETLKTVSRADGGGFKRIKARVSHDDRKEFLPKNPPCVNDLGEDCGRLGVNPPPRPFFCRSEVRVLAEQPLEVVHDLGWSSVLRSFCVSGGRGGTDIFAYRQRNTYKLAWIPLG